MKNNEAINSIVINVLSEKQTVKSLTQHVLQLCAMLEAQPEPASPKPVAPRTEGKKQRDYGPQSTRKATRHDAWDILYGQHRGSKARAIAGYMGLSRGQVYSIQGGYTFRDVKEDEFSNDEYTFDLNNHNDKLFLENFVGPMITQA